MKPVMAKKANTSSEDSCSLQRGMEEALRSVIEGTAGTTGSDFFRSLVHHLACALGVRFAFVGELAGPAAEKVRTLAVWAGDGLGENFEYDLRGSPCADVVGDSARLYISEVRRHFPDSPVLARMGVESYLGVPLRDSSGRSPGLLAVLDDKPMQGALSGAQWLVTVFAARAAAELERMRAEEEIRGLARFPSENPNPVLRIQADGALLYANAASGSLLREWGCSVGRPVPDAWCGLVADVFRSGLPRSVDAEHRERLFSFELMPQADAGYVNVYARDITERKQVEEYQALTAKLLEALNRPGERIGIFRVVTAMIKDFTGMDAVGIRLREGEQFPYFVTSGLPEDFVQAESDLCARGPDGEVLRDEQGKPFLECMCGNVLSGRTDPARPFFTEGGSFWTNSTTGLLDGTSDEDRGAQTRNRCNTAGYESVALIPIRASEEIIGLLQLNDTRANCFTPVMIRFLEQMGASIGMAIKRHQTAEALRESETKFRDLVEGTGDLVTQVDGEGRFLYVNHSVEAIFGLPAEECVGRVAFDFVHPEDRAPTREAFAGWVRGKVASASFENRQVGGTGEVHHILWTVSPHFDGAGKVTQINSIGNDITERKRAEQMLKRTAADLARSNRELEEFAYVASHDLREPLRMVTGYMELLRRRCEGRLTADAEEFIAYAVDGATRMQTLIADLLAYSRVGTAGGGSGPTDCRAVLDRILSDLRPSIAEAGAAVTWDPLPSVWAEETQLAQLFQNLLANALKFRGDRTPEIHVCARRGDRQWLFSVRDNGIGIDPQFAERIFLIFQRLHTRRQYPGTGIGLAICKKIVERHGGRIWVESQPGQGATFHFTIPDRGDPG